MAETPTPSGEDKEKIADADLLFGGEEPVESSRATGPVSGPAGGDIGDGYDVAGADEPEPDAPPRPVPPPIPPAPPRARPRRGRPSGPTRPRAEPSQAVDQVWTRGAEWGASLALARRRGGSGSALLVYAALSAELYALAMFLMFVGGLT